MEVSFPQDGATYVHDRRLIAFLAVVDARPVLCRITDEALWKRFGPRMLRDEGSMAAFLANREAIEAEARAELLRTKGNVTELDITSAELRVR